MKHLGSVEVPERDRRTSVVDRRTSAGYGKDADRIAAIARTRHETVGPEGIDIRKLVADAASAYWKNREDEMRRDSRNLQEEVADCCTHVLEPDCGSTAPIFWVDALAAVLPPAALVSVYFALLKSEGTSARSSAQIRDFPCSGFFCCGASIRNITRTKNRLMRSEAAIHSLGSLAAGVCIALAALGLLASNVKQKRDASINRLEELAVLSLQQRQRTGAFLQTAVMSTHVKTNEVTMDRAVYRADADSGSFVAEIGPTGGVLVPGDRIGNTSLQNSL